MRLSFLAVCFASVLIVFIAFPLFAGTPAPSGQPSSTPAATPKNRCCFCVYPDPGEEDCDAFRTECEVCFLNPKTNCDVKVSVANSEFTDAFVKSYSCTSVALTNNNHGPDPSKITTQINVCLAAFPGCPVTARDLSCSSWSDEASAQAEIKRIQAEIGPGAKVELCGNLDSCYSFVDCSTYSRTKSYVISPSTVTERYGPCKEPGLMCSPGGTTFKCTDWYGGVLEQSCCEIQEVAGVGVYGTPGEGCLGGEANCPVDCSSMIAHGREGTCRCDGTILVLKYCVSLADTSKKVCLKGGQDCASLGMSCQSSECDCVTKSPSPSPSIKWS